MNNEFVLTQVWVLNTKRGHSAQSDRAAPAGNQQLICLRSLLINMDNFDPQNGWGFLSNWITVSLLASKYCLELIPLSVATIYLHSIRRRVVFPPFDLSAIIGCGTENACFTSSTTTVVLYVPAPSVWTIKHWVTLCSCHEIKPTW